MALYLLIGADKAGAAIVRERNGEAACGHVDFGVAEIVRVKEDGPAGLVFPTAVDPEVDPDLAAADAEETPEDVGPQTRDVTSLDTPAGQVDEMDVKTGRTTRKRSR